MRKNGSRLSVLVVEDDPDIAELLEGAIACDGHSPYVCGTVAGARQALGQGLAPDVVLLDLMLPDEPGDALIDELRRVSGVIVAMSANDELLEKVGARVDHAISKPFHLSEIRALIY